MPSLTALPHECNRKYMLCYGYNDSPPLKLLYNLCFVTEINAATYGCNPKRRNHKSMLCFRNQFSSTSPR